MAQRFSKTANDIFRIPSVDDLDKATLISFVKKFESEQQPRLTTLQEYFLNDTAINDREPRDSTRADNRLSHNFARYISTLIQGYILGKPITYNHENEDLLAQINEFNDKNNEQSHNALMELNLSIYGRAHEMVYQDDEAKERLAVLDPKETFVIYDRTVEMKPIAAVRYYKVELGEETRKYVELYTAQGVTSYETKESLDDLSETGTATHPYGAVPIIEYWNNDERIGDYEPVLDQIDGYDTAQSDTANGMEDFADAYLVLQGQPNTESGDIEDMKESRVIVLDEPTAEGAKPAAYYLVKQYDVEGEEAFKNRLVNDIHKLSFVPDLSDEEFSSNVSGEAMKYKLFVLDQLRATKERLFKRGIMARLRLLANVWSIKRKEDGIENIEIVFTPNLPANVKELVEIAKQLEGIVSDETQLSILPMVEDIEAEKQRLDEEKEEAIQEFGQQEFPGGEVNGNE